MELVKASCRVCGVYIISFTSANLERILEYHYHQRNLIHQQYLMAIELIGEHRVEEATVLLNHVFRFTQKSEF
jgi:hypothetical protein